MVDGRTGLALGRLGDPTADGEVRHFIGAVEVGGHVLNELVHPSLEVLQRQVAKEHHHELVPAQSGDESVREGVLHHLGGGGERRIARLVPPGVVDLLKVVEVQVDADDVFFVLVGLHVVLEVPARGQAGEGVLPGDLQELLLKLQLLRHVPCDADGADDRTVLVEDGGLVGLQPAQAFRSPDLLVEDTGLSLTDDLFVRLGAGVLVLRPLIFRHPPDVVVAAPLDFLLRLPDELAEGVVDLDVSALQVLVPDEVRQGIDGLIQLVLSCPEVLLRLDLPQDALKTKTQHRGGERLYPHVVPQCQVLFGQVLRTGGAEDALCTPINGRTQISLREPRALVEDDDLAIPPRQTSQRLQGLEVVDEARKRRHPLQDAQGNVVKPVAADDELARVQSCSASLKFVRKFFAVHDYRPTCTLIYYYARYLEKSKKTPSGTCCLWRGVPLEVDL